MSDLSRLRARWIRLEQRIVKLHNQHAESLDDEEMKEIAVKIAKAQEALTLCINQVNAEEKRLIAADAMLRFTNV
jgi:hypothetical protein